VGGGSFIRRISFVRVIRQIDGDGLQAVDRAKHNLDPTIAQSGEIGHETGRNDGAQQEQPNHQAGDIAPGYSLRLQIRILSAQIKEGRDGKRIGLRAHA
jgi:hypothetical protein